MTIWEAFQKPVIKYSSGCGSFKYSKSDAKIRRLGRGASGSVEAYMAKNGELYVVKTYHSKETYESKEEYQKRVLHEYWMLQRLQHENFITVYGYKISQAGSKVVMFLEEGSPNLYRLLQSGRRNKYTQEEMLCLWKQLCHGIAYMHEQNICHRDLKLDNILLDPKSRLIKIIDLATAVQLEENGEALGLVGSEAYASPETFGRISYDGKKADIWSLGIILYYFLNRRFPWESAKSSDKHYMAFITETRSSSASPDFSNGCFPQPVYGKSGLELGSESVLRLLPLDSVQLTRKIFDPDPARRPELIDFYKDSWFLMLQACNSKIPCGFQHTIVSQAL